MDFNINKPYAEDHALLKELGPPLWNAKLQEETFIGEVHPFPAEEEPDGRTKVQVFVSCARRSSIVS